MFLFLSRQIKKVLSNITFILSLFFCLNFVISRKVLNFCIVCQKYCYVSFYDKIMNLLNLIQNKKYKQFHV